MSKGDISLGAESSEVLLSPFGRKLSIEEIESSREARTVDGTLKKDIIFVKYQFTLDYEIITGTALAAINTIYSDTAQPLNLIIDNGGTPDEYTVYMKPVSRKRLILQDDGLWTGVSIELVEE